MIHAGREGVVELAEGTQGIAEAAVPDAAAKIRRSVAAAAAFAGAKASPASSGNNASPPRSPTAAKAAKVRRTGNPGEVSSPRRAVSRQLDAVATADRRHVGSPGSAAGSPMAAAMAPPWQAGQQEALPRVESAAQFVRQKSLEQHGRCHGDKFGGDSGSGGQQADAGRTAGSPQGGSRSGGKGRDQRQADGPAEQPPGRRLPKAENAPDDIEGELICITPGKSLPWNGLILVVSRDLRRWRLRSIQSNTAQPCCLLCTAS